MTPYTMHRFTLAGWSPETTEWDWPEALDVEEFLELHGFNPIDALTLGHSPSLCGCTVRAFLHPDRPGYLVELAFDALFTFVLVDSAPALWRLLSELAPVVSASLASDAAGSASSLRTPSRRASGNKCGNIGGLPDPWLAASRHGNGGRK